MTISTNGLYQCPRCQTKTTKYHCKSPYCIWLTCYACVPYKSVVIFRKDPNRYWIKEEQ